MTAKITILKMLLVYIVLYARHFLPVKSLPKYYLYKPFVLSYAKCNLDR